MMHKKIQDLAKAADAEVRRRKSHEDQDGRHCACKQCLRSVEDWVVIINEILAIERALEEKCSGSQVTNTSETTTSG